MLDTEKSFKLPKWKKRKPLDKRLLARRILTAVITLILLAALCFAGVLELLTLTEYRPLQEETISVDNMGDLRTPTAGEPLTVVTWNTGYAALGDNADFFMDGGESVQTADHERVISNLQGIANEIAALTPDVVFLQEVDRDSTRSHRINEEIWLGNALLEQRGTGYSTAFAYNHKVAFIPYPVPPIGRVQAGLMTMTRFSGASAQRIQLPCPFKWPMRTANLKRGLLVERIPVTDPADPEARRDLVLVNLHLEAYDDGEGKAEQTAKLRSFLQNEVGSGNYVIAGGDFNQIFSDQDTVGYAVPEGSGLWEPGIIDTAEMGPLLTCLMDASVPSCRSLDRPYAGADHTDFQYYLIDGFIVSDNVTVESVQTKDLGFVVSDHNPVILKCSLQSSAPEKKK